MTTASWRRPHLTLVIVGAVLSCLGMLFAEGWKNGDLFVALVAFVMTALLALTAHLARTARCRARELESEIAERRQAETALCASEARYRSLIENLEHSVYLKDHHLRFVAASKHFCEGLGFDEAAIIGRSDADFYPPPVAQKYAAEDRLVLKQGKRLELEEPSSRQGKLRIFRVTKTPVKDDRDQIVGVLGICWDVTEQRGLEEQVRHGQKMDAIGQLAGGIAHDFNNLLTAILGNLCLVQANMARNDPNRELVHGAEKASQRAADLTAQLLGFSRQTPFRSQPIDLNSTIDEVSSILSRTIDARICKETNKAADLWLVQADAGQMNQMLVNLCLNARDAMPHGGRLLIESSNVTLDEDYARLHLEARPGEFVVLRVNDTGHGMTPEIRARIFEPFYTTKELGKGTGLGLAMVFGIIKQHNGWIDCYTEVNKGTRFDIYLPRCQVRVQSATPAPAPRPHLFGNETILLVDDEPMLRNLGQAILQRHGYHVLVAEDGSQALQQYQTEQAGIDLVILGLTVPRLSARDTFRQLRQLDSGVRVLFASGSSAEYVTADVQAQALGFVRKPYRPDDLAHVVRASLDKAKARSECEQPLQRCAV